MSSLRERIDEDDLFFDSAIVSHGFAPHLRDYDVVIDVPAALPPEVAIGDSTGSYIMGRYRYRFTHCLEAHLLSTVSEDVWKRSWDEVFTDYATWVAASHPEGFVWGTNHADAYPGLSYVPESTLATAWTARLGRDMHEVIMETNVFVLRLVCHELRVLQLAVGDPETGELRSVENTG